MGRNKNDIELGKNERTFRARVEIYALCCPDTMKIMYIGKANDSEKRLKSHYRDMRRRDYPLYMWLRELQYQGKVAVMRIIEVCNEGNWREREKYHIANNDNLLNVAAGGEEPYCSKEQRAVNGRNNARVIHDNPDNKRIWAVKRNMGQALTFLKKNGKTETYNRVVDKLKLAAMKSPSLFGAYSQLTKI